MENFISCLQARIVLGQQLTVLMLIFILAWLAYGLSHGYQYYLPYVWQYLRGKVSLELQTNKPLHIATLRTNSCNTCIQKRFSEVCHSNVRYSLVECALKKTNAVLDFYFVFIFQILTLMNKFLNIVNINIFHLHVCFSMITRKKESDCCLFSINKYVFYKWLHIMLQLVYFWWKIK